MQVRVHPSKLCGSIRAIPSKSAAHRLLICAALADNETKIACPQLSKDILATADCLRALGAGIDYADGVFSVKPISAPAQKAELDVGESGSTLRFILPIVCALGIDATIKMHGRLPERPLSPLWEELEAHGAVLSRPERDQISVSGQLIGGSYRIQADISSQFISGLLFALPLLAEESSIELLGSIESAPYIHMTRNAQRSFGIETEFDGRVFRIGKSWRYSSPTALEVEGDWSNACFWLAASLLCDGAVTVEGLDANSLQGDKEVLPAMHAIMRGNAVIDMRDIPDALPILSVIAAVSPGKTEFINAARLRIKESDRLTAVRRMLEALGGKCEEKADALTVFGQEKLRGGTVDSVNDHRIAMSAAIAAIVCSDCVTILGAEAVEKSYPTFFDDYKMLGGKVL